MEIFLKDKLLREFFVREDLVLFWDEFKLERKFFKINNVFACFQKDSDKFEIKFSEKSLNKENFEIDLDDINFADNKLYNFFQRLNFERKYCFKFFYNREYKPEFVLVRLCHFLSVEMTNILIAMGFSRKKLDLVLELKEKQEKQVDNEIRKYQFSRWSFRTQLYDFLMYEIYNALNQSLNFLERNLDSLELCKLASTQFMSEEKFLIMLTESQILHNQLLQFPIEKIVNKIGKIHLFKLF